MAGPTGPTGATGPAGSYGPQSANTVLAGPASGSATAPGFRTLVNADVVAGLGYQPARPVTAFSASTSNVAIPGNSAYGIALSGQFVATATTMLITSSAYIQSPSGSATEIVSYLKLNNNTAGNTLASGVQDGCYITSAATHGGKVNPILVASGLTVGATYEVDFLMASTGTVNTTAVALALAGVNL